MDIEVKVDLRFADNSFISESFDSVWLGTGGTLDISREPVFSHLIKQFPIETVDNAVPVLNEGHFLEVMLGLRWDHKVPCHVIGAYSCLTVGPGAFNLGACVSCADRVVPVIEAQWASKRMNISNKEANKPANEYDDPGNPRPLEYLCKTRKRIGNGASLYSVLAGLEI